MPFAFAQIHTQESPFSWPLLRWWLEVSIWLAWTPSSTYYRTGAFPACCIAGEAMSVSCGSRCILEKSWVSEFYLNVEMAPASWTDGQLHSNSQSAHTSIVTERFSCDQSWESLPNAGPFVTVVDSIKSDMRGLTGDAVSAPWSLAILEFQYTPGLMSTETIALVETRNLQGFRYLDSHTQWLL